MPQALLCDSGCAFDKLFDRPYLVTQPLAIAVLRLLKLHRGHIVSYPRLCRSLNW